MFDNPMTVTVDFVAGLSVLTAQLVRLATTTASRHARRQPPTPSRRGRSRRFTAEGHKERPHNLPRFIRSTIMLPAEIADHRHQAGLRTQTSLDCRRSSQSRAAGFTTRLHKSPRDK